MTYLSEHEANLLAGPIVQAIDRLTDVLVAHFAVTDTPMIRTETDDEKIERMVKTRAVIDAEHRDSIVPGSIVDELIKDSLDEKPTAGSICPMKDCGGVLGHIEAHHLECSKCDVTHSV